MARLSVKHQNQRIIEYKDFTGGLNTSNAEEMIAPNELSHAVNVEIDKATGVLRTVAGTVTMLEVEDGAFTDFAYDKLGQCFVICSSDGTVHSSDGETITSVGTLTGSTTPAFALWDKGLLIASGGKLQYFHEGTLETLDESPDVCNGVFVKDGRIWVYYDDTIRVSGVGDPHGWETDPDDQSTAQFIDIGYKDGGHIVGVVALSSDILIIKSNGHVFHLSGQFPDWAVREVSREVSCKGFRSCVGLINEAIILGDTLLQSIATTDTYGDMRARELSRKVRSNILNLSKLVKLRYVPPLNQIWFVDGTIKLLFLDVDTGGYYERQFSSEVVDVCSVGDTVYLLKRDKLQRLDNAAVLDEGLPMPWRWKGKTLVSNNEYLVKRARADITPLSDNYIDCRFYVGNAVIKGTLPWVAQSLWHDYTPLMLNDRELYSSRARKPVYANSDELYGNADYLFENEAELYSLNMFRTDTRFIERMRGVRIESIGQGGQLMFNGLNCELAEV